MLFTRRLLVCLTLTLNYSVSFTSANALRTVVLTGDLAPGTGANFQSLNPGFLTLNNAGQTAFVGSLTGSGVNSSNSRGIWKGGGSTLALVARQGSGAPGTSEVFTSIRFPPVINNAGQTAFTATVPRTRGSGGLWSEGSGSLALVAREGDVAPGTFARFTKFSFHRIYPTFNDAGQIAFPSKLSGIGVNDNNDRGIWSEGSGSLALVARTGDSAPGTNANFENLFNQPSLNNMGQTAFSGELTGLGIDGSNDRGIWSEGSGSLALVAREGDPAPGTSANFSGFTLNPPINDLGQTVFGGALTGLGIDNTNETGIWSGAADSLALVVRAGDAAPDTGAKFSIFGHEPFLNNTGQLAFSGYLTGLGVDSSNDQGIWSGRSDSLALVAREGNPAPGTNAFFQSGSDELILNGAGQVAFIGALIGNGVDRNNSLGIWAQNATGVLTLIVRNGDLLDVDDGPNTDFRTISSLRFLTGYGNDFVRGNGFNDLGQVVFGANFSDGTSGIFISNLAAVPEPNSFALMVLAMLTMIWPNTEGVKNRKPI